MPSLRIRPIGDKVLVRAIPAPAASTGGILYADITRKNERPYLGTVVAVGPGQINLKTGDRIPPEVKVGDRVALSKMTWQFDFDDVIDSHPDLGGHVLVREQDLVAVVEDDADAA